MGFLPRCDYLGITVWLHYVQVNETPGKKQDENYTRIVRAIFSKLLGAALNKTAAGRLLTSHLTKHPSKTSKTCW